MKYPHLVNLFTITNILLDAAYRQGGLSHTQFGEPDQIIATSTNPGDFSFVSGCRRLEAPLG